jgi:hypothetical protein
MDEYKNTQFAGQGGYPLPWLLASFFIPQTTPQGCLEVT